jgi:acetylornithine deacetylase
MNVLELTRNLISIPSISGNEKLVADYLVEYLSRAGFDVETQDIGASRPNVYARRGDPDVVLSSHIDTVPPFFEFSEDDENIFGRGACDAKGIIAAMIKAGEKLIESGIEDFGLLFVVGEEAGSPGARIANSISNRSRFLINGEPTESKLAVGSKGALRALLRTSGRAAHAAYPEHGESAIEKLLEVLNDLRGTDFPRHSTLGATTMNIGVIRGGVAANVVPASAEAELMFRVVTDTDTLKRLIEERVRSRASIEYQFECDPVFTKRLEGFQTCVVAFTTDIPLLSNWGKPLLFGPGSILDAHTAHEKISKRELSDAVDVYARLVVQLKKGEVTSTEIDRQIEHG